MEKILSLDLTKVKPFLADHEVGYFQPMVAEAHKMIHAEDRCRQ